MPAKKLSKEEKAQLVKLMNETVDAEKRIADAQKIVESKKLELSAVLGKIGKLAGTPRDIMDPDTGIKLGTAYSAKFKVNGDLKTLKGRWNKELGDVTYFFATQSAEDTIEVF